MRIAELRVRYGLLYRRGMIRTTFTASPRRGRVLAAKAVVLAAVTFVASLIAVAITIPLGDHLLRGNGNPIFPLPTLSAAAVTVVIAGIVLPYLLAVITGVLPVGAEEWLARVTPAAAFAIQQATPAYPQVEATYTPGTGYFPLAPWAGFAVLCAWAAAFVALAAVRLRRSDA